MKEQNLTQEDEISLLELFNMIWKQKLFIIIFTALITLASIVYIYSKPSIYQVKSNIQIGQVNNKLIDDPNIIIKSIKLKFKENKNNSNAYVSNIKFDIRSKKFLIVTTEGLSISEAKLKNEEVLQYLKKYYNNSDMLKNYSNNLDKKLVEYEQEIVTIKTKQLIDLKNKIKTIKAQEIGKINEQIKHKYKEINSLKKRIAFNREKMAELTNAINKLYEKNGNDTNSMVASMQLLNFHNLVLNIQERIESYSLKIDNIQNIQLINLNIEKENFIINKLGRLNNQLEVVLPKKIKDINDSIENLELQKLSTIKEFTIFGDYLINSQPVKPKKTLIVVVSFVSGFVLSIFIVLFMQFIRRLKR